MSQKENKCNKDRLHPPPICYIEIFTIIQLPGCVLRPESKSVSYVLHLLSPNWWLAYAFSLQQAFDESKFVILMKSYCIHFSLLRLLLPVPHLKTFADVQSLIFHT